MNETITKEKVLVKDIAQSTHNIILYNDPVNTFHHVMSALIKHCKHDKEQAEQITILVHFKGRLAVKNGSLDDLLPINELLGKEGLTTNIE